MTPASDLPGEPSYGRYETLFRIAAGGMAEVYAARARGEAGFEKLVALKRMLPHLSSDERFVAMFMDEGRLAANISSPHVVSTLDLGRASDGSLYLVMELVVGVTLTTLVRNALRAGEKIPIDVAVELIAQAAHGLHDAHEATTPYGEPLHVVHRDVSPQNILIGADGRVRITDFGVARATQRSTQTTTGEIKGKLAYFSPEQCANSPLDRRSDVFSLATVAWETLTGDRLFFADNPMAIFERVSKMPIPDASSLRPEVPAPIAAVIARGLARDRDARFASAGDFERALRDAARACDVVAPSGEVSRFVRAHGGDSLAKMEARIRASHATSEAGRASAPPGETPPSHSGMVARGARTATPEDVVLHEQHTVVTPPPVEMPRPPRRASIAIWALAIAAAAGIGAWLAIAQRDPMVATPITTPPPAPSAEPPAPTIPTIAEPTPEPAVAEPPLAPSPELAAPATPRPRAPASAAAPIRPPRRPPRRARPSPLPRPPRRPASPLPRRRRALAAVACSRSISSIVTWAVTEIPRFFPDKENPWVHVPGGT
ncbi:serine/threonine-protein kinase [Sandaracinus amylolyticus]|uniref:Serine/threonine protein kinase n=1 Tax=Sandaracinus amylolyticus TaxID=927083 RepID=A0A0F6YN63_9BACT|nr:serine/threonine-protein kinase [Sandaracinus amylolyticus]AKF11576.1 serine/threonine protein kinase [Sandaracinus amylolyticus]